MTTKIIEGYSEPGYYLISGHYNQTIKEVKFTALDEENNSFQYKSCDRSYEQELVGFDSIIDNFYYTKFVEIDEEGNQRYMGTIPKWWEDKGFSSIPQVVELGADTSQSNGILQIMYTKPKAKMRLLHATPEGSSAISFYPNLKEYLRQRKTKMKPGKFYRFVNPEATDAEVEKFVNKYREKYSDKCYTLHVGKEVEDFEFAYLPPNAPSETPATRGNRKSLVDSCMQHDFKYSEGHPAGVYASGDFDVVYLKDHNGLIAGRCVIYTGKGKPQAGPCYGVCEKSLNMLEDYLKSIDAETYNPCWDGAKLLRIEVGDKVLMPYLDVGFTFDECSTYFKVFEPDGQFEAGSTEGAIYLEGRHICEHCEDSVSEDEVYTNEDGYCYCYHCYNEQFVHDEDGNEIRIDDAVRVYTSNIYGSHEVWMHCDSGEYAECEATNELWDMDCILTNCVEYEFVCQKYAEKYMKLNEDGDYYYEKEEETV